MKLRKSCGIILCGILAIMVCNNVWAGWSLPVLVHELNGDYDDPATSPCLSRDGLTMYISRFIPTLNQYSIIEAYRDNSDSEFTSGIVLVELNNIGYDVMTPWVSSDGLRLYYREAQPIGTPRLKMAARGMIGMQWTPVRTFYELQEGTSGASEPTLTEDELTIVFRSRRSGSAGEQDLWIAERDSIENQFNEPVPLSQFNTTMDEPAACLLPDGLTVYFISENRDGFTGYNIYKASRLSRLDTFDNTELVITPGASGNDAMDIFVTEDELTLYYTVNGKGVYLSSRTDIVTTYHVDRYSNDPNHSGLSRANAFGSIQEAVNIADNDCLILVWPGVYNERVDFLGKAITLRSAAEAAEVRTNTGYAFSFHTGEGADSVLENFVIRDSEYGIYLANGSSPTIRNLTIVNNEYGISAFDGSSPDISNCILWGNTIGDLFDCQATYSCIQDGAEGEGNIDTYPLFAEDSYHLQSERGRLVPVDPGQPAWTEPVKVPELDGSDGSSAGGPHMSEDGLSMYFHRYIPGLGFTCIVEATRSFPAGSFTSERVLTELVSEGNEVDTPWLSLDGLRLYYKERISGINKIRMAHRPTTADEWTPVRTFEELHVDNQKGKEPSLTGDELEIFFSSTRPGGIGGIDLWTASRSSIDEPFGNIRSLNKINSAENDSMPHIMPNGLTIYFNSLFRDNTGANNLFMSTRPSRSDEFSNVQLIELPGYETISELNPYISSEQKIIYIQRGTLGIYVSKLIESQWVLDNSTSLCVDAGNPAVNPSRERMPNGGRVNMGAYGGTGSASMSEWPIEGDINHDGIVNVGDLAVISRDWLNSLPWFGE